MPMTNLTPLFHQLTQAVEQLYHTYRQRPSNQISATFDRTLFSEDFQPFAFYYAEVNQTLSQLQGLTQYDGEEAAFLAEKLLAQCTALHDALLKQPRGEKSAVNFQPVLNKREQLRQAIDKLPPRKRLVKYYDALRTLNEKINEKNDQLNSPSAQENAVAQQLAQLQQRRQRCLEAIELLEEYLAFKEGH